MTQMVKSPLTKRETQVPSLGQEDLLKEGMATHSGILGWRIPQIEEAGGLQSTGSQRVRHDRNDWALVHALANAAVLYSTSEAWAPLMRISGFLECCHSRMLLWSKDSKLFPRLFPENYSLRILMLSSLQHHHLWTWDSWFQPYLVVGKYVLLIFIG